MVPTTRRRTVGLLGATLAAGLLATRSEPAAQESGIAAVERALGGRIGAAVARGGSGLVVSYRADERFPMCSTFKALAAGLVLARADAGQERLDRRVVFNRGDLVTYSPVTEARVGGDGMSLAEICHAAVTRSDNTAGNLLLASFGGPEAITAFARKLGDPVTRLDRTETALNEALPGDPRDTTSPAAMLGCLDRLVGGEALSPDSRSQLRAWLLDNRTGDARIRAVAPAGWTVGDKTGTGERGAASDIAILWPPGGGAPIVLTVYLADSGRPIGDLNAAIRDVARIMIDAARV